MKIKTSNDEKHNIEAEYEELVELARKEYPNLIKEIETFTSNRVELQSYKDYLDAFNDMPTVISLNSVR